MSSEKFCLKWNDFQQNVSKTFSQLRQQTGLFDVTLVSSNQRQVSAHRLVLSACSDFFKNIFHRITHSHPLLYLDGVDHGEINLMFTIFLHLPRRGSDIPGPFRQVSRSCKEIQIRWING